MIEIAFIAGLWAGTIVGVFIVALCVAAKGPLSRTQARRVKVAP